MEMFSSALEVWSELIIRWRERDRETNITSIVLRTLEPVSPFSTGDLNQGDGGSGLVDVHVTSISALDSPLRTVRTMAIDPQLLATSSVMSLLGIWMVLTVLTRLRTTSVDRVQSSCVLGGGDF